ncbi:hypothetical protein Q9L58_010870, partial [Maublancomyces gigas]
MNDLLLRQNEEMAKEIGELKMLITNLGNQMTNTMAALSRTVIGKVDGIHRSFNVSPATKSKNQSPDQKDNQQHSTTNKKGKGKGPAGNAAAPPLTTADNGNHPFQHGWGPGTEPPAPPENTWATITKNGKTQKDNQSPTKQKRKNPINTTKSMIIQRSGEEKDEALNLFHLRNTINRDLIEAKAPESLQVTGISWNQKGNLMLYTREGFLSGDFDLHQAIISKAVSTADPSSLFVNKQETWHKLTVHGVSLTDYPDTAIGMAKLKRELEFGNADLHITTEPRYMTHPDKREGKFHSSVVISLTDKD